MTSFGNSNIDLFLKFFYVGLIFGLIMIIFDLVCKIFKRNVYVFNLAGFVFFLLVWTLWNDSGDIFSQN